jgi:Na+/proline symporter
VVQRARDDGTLELLLAQPLSPAAWLLAVCVVRYLALIVPLAAGIFWRRANTVGATLSVVFGLGTWVSAEFVAPEATVPPQLVGLAASLFGMVLVTYAARAQAAHPPAHPAAHPPAHPPAHSRHG